MRMTIQAIFRTENVQIKHFAEGCFNKLYEVQVNDQAPLLLRVALPVDPQNKTMNEASELSRPGPILSTCFFYGLINKSDINLGPFRNSNEWFAARLEATKRDATATMAKWCGKGNLDCNAVKEIDDAARTFGIAERLLHLIWRIFPFPAEAETTVLYHDDLHGNNILVDDAGNITGIVDWECVSIVPLWKACGIPQFLFDQPRWTEPDRRRYRHDANGGISELYYKHLHQYETTRLREVFLGEMERLDPRWMDIHKKTQLLRDFDFAVQFCNDVAVLKHIVKWAEAVEAGGDVPRMWDVGPDLGERAQVVLNICS
ncbi:hypothetical protein ACKAV7_011022 [Fusarium commune]